MTTVLYSAEEKRFTRQLNASPSKPEFFGGHSPVHSNLQVCDHIGRPAPVPLNSKALMQRLEEIRRDECSHLPRRHSYYY